MRLAKERSIPPYMVASDKTLREMCLRLPRTKEEMLEIGGIGERKYEQYGAAFIECIQKAWEMKKDFSNTSEYGMIIEDTAGPVPTPGELREEERKTGGTQR